MTQRFRYTCKKCKKGFRIEIDTSSYSVHSVICPFCEQKTLFDNRTGALDRKASSYNNERQTSDLNQNQRNQPIRKSTDFSWSSRSTGKVGSKPSSSRPVGSSLLNRGRLTNSVFSKIGSIFTLSRSDRSKYFLLAGMLILGIGIIYSVILLFQFAVFDPEPYIGGLNSRSPNRIYDRNGELISELFTIKTGTLKFDQIPKPMIDTLLFAEDQNFFSHGAIDFFATGRAVFKNIIHGGYVQGASTITQQLSRILLDNREKTLSRKVKEAALAFSLESRFSKEKILTGYFNNVYLGHGAYGFDTAADFYFKKNLNQLNFTERLALASLPSAPERFSPLRNPELLIRKMDHIYERMRESGFNSPTPDNYEKEKMATLHGLNRSPTETVFGTRTDYGPYVTEYIRAKLNSLLGDDTETLAGLRIETSIDVNLQKSAAQQSIEWLTELRKSHPYRLEAKGDETILKSQIRREYLLMALGGTFFGLPVPRTGNKRLETASIGIEPATGEILFMQGGSELFPENQLNRSIQMRRQTGSAIKPIVYSAGAESGKVNPATPLEDSPLYFSGIKTADGKDFWLPDNIDQDYEGEIPARIAMAKSRNIPAIRAAMMIGLDRVGEQFHKFFFHTDSEFNKRFRKEQGVAIGILEMSPIEMASAYSAFANNGIIKRPYLIRRIVSSSGKVLYEGVGKDEFNFNMPSEVRAISGDAAEVIASMMVDSAKYGGSGRGGFTSPNLLGKTGTTNNYRDAWFIGVLPHLSTAIWIGFDNPAVSMNRGTGAGTAGPLYGRIIKHSGESSELVKGGYTFEPKAKHITVCADTGLLPNRFCPRKKTEIFAEAGVPHETCEKHGKDTTERPTMPDLPTDSDFN